MLVTVLSGPVGKEDLERELLANGWLGRERVTAIEYEHLVGVRGVDIPQHKATASELAEQHGQRTAIVVGVRMDALSAACGDTYTAPPKMVFSGFVLNQLIDETDKPLNLWSKGP